jgi:hypothetical protein
MFNRPRQAREPVAPAVRSSEVHAKVQHKQLSDGSPAHSFQSLLRNLATIVRNTCRSRGKNSDTPSFTIETQHAPNQQEAFRLLKEIKV